MNTSIGSIFGVASKVIILTMGLLLVSVSMYLIFLFIRAFITSKK